MKKLFVVLFLALLLSNGYHAIAAYLHNFPQTIVQPNGDTIHCFATGDEYYNWLHTASGHTIVKNPLTGYYVFALKVNDDLVPSNYIVGIDDPFSAGIPTGLNISPEKIKKIRSDIEAATPPKKQLPGYSGSKGTKSAGALNNIVIFVRFSDQGEYTDQSSYYSNMFNDSASGVNSMYNYFKEASYNSVYISSTFYPVPSGATVISYQDIYPRSYYMPYDSLTNPNGYKPSQETDREHTLLENAVNAVKSQISTSLNLDYDNDGYVDNICFIVQGTTTAWSTLLWPHRWALYSRAVYINGKQVWDYNFQIQTHLSSSGVGVLCHEMFHTLGAPDLYHYTSNGIAPVGVWDLMASNTNPPQHSGAFMKWKYGKWISNIPSITTSGTYTLNPVTSSTNNCNSVLND